MPPVDFECRDCIHVGIKAELSFLDRLRVLFSGKLSIKASIITENEVGRTASKSVIYPVL